jgi:hypothetical protein
MVGLAFRVFDDDAAAEGFSGRIGDPAEWANSTVEGSDQSIGAHEVQHIFDLLLVDGTALL